MARSKQVTIGQCMVATAIIGYFCAFRELAVLLGIFAVTLLFVAPVPALMYFICRLSLGTHRPPTPRP